MTEPAIPSVPSLSVDSVNGILHAIVEIAAPPERVFEALTHPRELASWWGSEDTYRTSDWHVDARPGGRWSARTIDAAGNAGAISGEYSVVDPARVLEHTWFSSLNDSSTGIIRYDLDPSTVDGVPGTRLTITHTRPDATTVAITVAMHSFDLGGVITCLARHTTHMCGSSADTSMQYTLRPTRRRIRRIRRSIVTAQHIWNH